MYMYRQFLVSIFSWSRKDTNLYTNRQFVLAIFQCTCTDRLYWPCPDAHVQGTFSDHLLLYTYRQPVLATFSFTRTDNLYRHSPHIHVHVQATCSGQLLMCMYIHLLCLVEKFGKVLSVLSYIFLHIRWFQLWVGTDNLQVMGTVVTLGQYDWTYPFKHHEPLRLVYHPFFYSWLDVFCASSHRLEIIRTRLWLHGDNRICRLQRACFTARWMLD